MNQGEPRRDPPPAGIIGWYEDLRARLVQHDPALVRHVCWLAMWQIMSFRGLNVEAGSNNLFQINRDAALAWLLRVARREISLNSDGGAVPGKGGPRVISATSRGWGDLPVR